MKIARFCLILFALTATFVSAAPKHKGGSVVPSKVAGGYYYYCYSDPDIIYDCSGTSCNCRGACDKECGGACDWDGSCIIV